jgi:SPP1 gp7 family putative phage head morphogenesis protein
MSVATIRPLPPKEAIAALFHRGRTLVPTHSWQDMEGAEHAGAYTVAKSAGFDILQDIFDEVSKVVGEGKSIRDATRDLTPILQAKGWWGRKLVVDPLTGETVPAQLGSTRRLRTIFDTNLRVSYAAGHWSRFEVQKATRPWLRYVAVMDERTRPEHAALHNLCLPVDHPFWKTWAPPNGWNCRCTLQSLSDRDVERMRGELVFEPPSMPMRTWTNRRTGEVQEIPEGIDPGWAYNPGQAGSRAVAAYADKLVAAPPELAAAAVGDSDFPVRPLADAFEAWVSSIAAGERVERSMYTVGAFDQVLLDRLAERNIRPQSAAITVSQQAITHALRPAKAEVGKAVGVDLLMRMPEALRSPSAVVLDKRNGALLWVVDVPGSKVAKLVIQVDRKERARPTGKGEKQTVVSNAFRTAGLVDPIALRDARFYDVLVGRV